MAFKVLQIAIICCGIVFGLYSALEHNGTMNTPDICAIHSEILVGRNGSLFSNYTNFPRSNITFRTVKQGVDLRSNVSSGIHGGEDVRAPNEILRTVFKITKDGNGNENGCTATFINTYNFLFTAAHCSKKFQPSTIWWLENESYQFPVCIHQIIFNPKWVNIDNNTNPFAYDMAVLLVTMASEHILNVKPALLKYPYKKMENDDSLTIYGYGAVDSNFTPSKYLKKVKMTVESSDPRDILIAKSNEGASCAGDSGAPSFSDKNELFGMIVGGFNVCDADGKSIIAPFFWSKKWLESIFDPKSRSSNKIHQ